MQEVQRTQNRQDQISRRRITTKREPCEVRVERSGTTGQHVPRRLFREDDFARTMLLLSPRRRHWTGPVRKQ